MDEKQPSWITAHVHMYEYFGGIAKMLVPDNCRTAVEHNKGRKDQRINAVYQEMARNDSTYKKVQVKYANPVLLIIDEWLLLKPTESEQHDILELLHRRRRKSSTIFCSQYDSNGWYDQLGGDDSPLAEAILDRIKHDAYKINIIPTDPANYRSTREV